MKTLIIINDPPYGTERVYNALRLAHVLQKKEHEVTVFLIGAADSDQLCRAPVGRDKFLAGRHHVAATIVDVRQRADRLVERSMTEPVEAVRRLFYRPSVLRPSWRSSPVGET